MIISEYHSQIGSGQKCILNHCAQHSRGLGFRFVRVGLLGLTGSKPRKWRDSEPKDQAQIVGGGVTQEACVCSYIRSICTDKPQG